MKKAAVRATLRRARLTKDLQNCTVDRRPDLRISFVRGPLSKARTAHIKARHTHHNRNGCAAPHAAHVAISDPRQEVQAQRVWNPAGGNKEGAQIKPKPKQRAARRRLQPTAAAPQRYYSPAEKKKRREATKVYRKFQKPLNLRLSMQFLLQITAVTKLIAILRCHDTRVNGLRRC